MNREALDEFFAKAEDVLEHWEPSDDAMVARMADEDADLPLADSYYSQGSAPSFWDVWLPRLRTNYERMFLDAVMWGNSFGEVRPEGIVHIPVTRWIEFDSAVTVPSIWPDIWEPPAQIDDFSFLREWSTEIVCNRAERELDELYPLVDFDRHRPAEECAERPAPVADVVVPRLPAEVWDRCERQRIARELTTGPRVRVGLDGHYRRHA